MKLNLNSQAEAFGCFLQSFGKHEFQDAQFSPYFNGRERGFVVSMDFSAGQRWAFFEHRNSDELCCVTWNEKSFPKDFYVCKDIPNSAYKSKWDVSKSFGCGQFGDAYAWLLEQIQDTKKQAA